MALELPYSIRILDSSPVDIWYGPYDTIGDALSSVPIPVRLNRTVKIGSVEYWWDGGTADEDLVVKISNQGITNSAADGQLTISDGTNLYGVSGISYNNLTDTLTFSSYTRVTDTSLSVSKSGVGVLLDVDAIEYNISIGNTGSYTSGPQGAIAIFDAVTPPSTSITNGVFLYSEGGVLKTRDSAGVVTILSGSGAGGSMSVGTINDTTKSADGAVISSSTLYMQTADATYPGLVSTGTQTFAGSKTFSDNATFNGWVTLNSRVPIGTNSFFLTDVTNGFRVHNSDNTSVLLKLTNSGNIGIGVDPAEKLHVSRGSSNGVIARFEGGATPYSTFIEHNATNTRIYNNLSRGFVLSPNNTDEYLFSPTGTFTINSSGVTAQTILQKSGVNQWAYGIDVGENTENWNLYNYGTSSIALKITKADNNMTLAGTGTAIDWVGTSDRRLKTNITPLGSFLDKITSIAQLIRGYDRLDTGKYEVGFIAQELFKIAPEYVVKPNDSGYYTVNYSKMVVPLYQGVAEIRSEVEILKQQLIDIKTKLNKHGITV